MPPRNVDVAVVVEKIKSTVGAEVAESVDALVQYAKVFVMPPERDEPDVMQVLLMEKHPPERLKPTFEVDVADPETVRPVKVVVPKPVLETLRNLVAFDEEATSKTGFDWEAVACTASVAKGEVVAMPTSPVPLIINWFPPVPLVSARNKSPV